VTAETTSLAITCAVGIGSYDAYFDTYTLQCDGSVVKTLTLYPTPNGAYTINMPYIQLLPDLSGTMTPAIECEQALEYGSTADGYRWKRQFAKAADMENKYEQAIIQLMWDRENYPNRVTLFDVAPYTRNTVY
jgi:hypothetical protein